MLWRTQEFLFADNPTPWKKLHLSIRVALVEKGDTIRSGAGGPGCDHWCQCPANPHSKVDPDERAKVLAQHPDTMSERPKGTPKGSYGNGIGAQITCQGKL